MDPQAEVNPVWERNLAALRGGQASVASVVIGEAAGVHASAPEVLDDADGLVWSRGRGGDWAATALHGDGKPVLLCSRFDPVAEAGKLVGGIDHAAVPVVAVLGVGLGYHVAALAGAMAGRGRLIVYEPGVERLRAVMRRVDLSRWLGAANVELFVGEVMDAELTRRLEGFAAMLTQGLKVVEHPPTRRLDAARVRHFGAGLTRTLAYCRTNVATALVNAARTYGNLTANLPQYAAGATTQPLLGLASRGGRAVAAVCVSAGPSLVKNIDVLKDPAVRRGVYVIAAQTALRPLLDRGIRPDFVTALDYSAVSRRFYEALPPLPDVTLVAEAKAHPYILDLYPGPVRTTRNGYLDALLGDLARPITPIPQGATVAHLSFYLAVHLGCDPVILIGQDLGFSDGLYYAPGTAIHREWACELNAFNTLEMMEWQRVVRMRGHLRRAEDIHGRPMFTDEQMATYLKQFERDFAKCIEEGGPTVIDATEGGVPKEGTLRSTLADAVREYVHRDAPSVPIAAGPLDPARLGGLDAVLRERIGQVRELAENARETIPILEKMQRHQREPLRMASLFKRLKRHQDEVANRLALAMRLVGELNTMGGFKRARADHAIEHAGEDPYARQRAQLDRDIQNLDWLAQTCDETRRLYEAARGRVTSELKRGSRVAA